MKTHRKRILPRAGCILLVLGMLLPTFSSCGNAPSETTEQEDTEMTVTEPGADTSGTVPAATEAPSASALLERGLGYLEEMKQTGKVTSGTNANYYLLGGEGITGLITDYIPSFRASDMCFFEIQNGQLVNVGGTKDLSAAGIPSAEPLGGGLWKKDSPELYDAAVAMAYAYYYQGNQINYDQRNKRRNHSMLPNDAVAERTVYMDCSSFANAIYYNGFSSATGARTKLSSDSSTKTFMSSLAEKAKAGNPCYFAYFKREQTGVQLWTGGIRDSQPHLDEATVLSLLQTNLQPGDVIVVRRGETVADTGHALVYVGDGKILHCTGYSIPTGATPETVMGYKSRYSDNSSTLADDPVNGETAVGAIKLLDAKYLFDASLLQNISGHGNENMKYLLYDGKAIPDGTSYPAKQVVEVGIIRPFGSGSWTTPTKEAKAEAAYSGITVEKTVKDAAGNAVYYRTVEPGQTLNVTVTVRNFAAWEIADIPVTDGEVLRGTVTCAPRGQNGSEQTVTYTYTVPADAPFYLETPRAFAGGISSNIVKLCVGKKTENAESVLKSYLASAPTLPKKTAGLTAAAAELYRSAFGAEIFTEYLTEDGAFRLGMNPAAMVKTSAEYNSFSSKLPVVEGLYGGYKVRNKSDYTMAGPDYTRRLRAEYLEPGDLIMVIAPNGSSFCVYEMYIFLNETSVWQIRETEAGFVVAEAYTGADKVASFLTSRYCTDGYCVLRPLAKQ